MILPLVIASAFLANSLALGSPASALNDGVAAYFGRVQLTESFTLVALACVEGVGMPNSGTGSARLWITRVAKLRGVVVSTGEPLGLASSLCSESKLFSLATSP